jgi:hypothetical protein
VLFCANTCSTQDSFPENIAFSGDTFWHPAVPLEVLSDHVDSLGMFLSQACLLSAFLYTAFEMASKFFCVGENT